MNTLDLIKRAHQRNKSSLAVLEARLSKFELRAAREDWAWQKDLKASEPDGPGPYSCEATKT